MASSGMTRAHAVALRRAFAWASRLESGELIDFAVELEVDTRDWSAAAAQQHASLVVSYWQQRAESRHRRAGSSDSVSGEGDQT